MKFPEIESSHTASFSIQTKKTSTPSKQKKKNRKEKIGYAIAIN